MKRLFLTSKFHHVAHDIAHKLSDEQKHSLVYITTPFQYRQFKDGELAWHYHNLSAMKKYGYEYEFYDIIGKKMNDLERDLASYQTMYVEGGNPFFFMHESSKNSFGEYVKTRLGEGMIYISESAGSVCAGIDIAANSRPGKSASDYDLRDSQGFGLVNFTILPHWGQNKKRDDYLQFKIPQSYNQDFPYILLSNHQYIEVDGDRHKIIDVTKDKP